MKRRRLSKFLAVLTLLSICYLKSNSQSKVYTFIQENATVYESSDFYIYKIIDARKNKASIGSIYSSDKRKKYAADFNSTLSNELYSFYKNAFPPGKQKRKIILLVDSFSIDHQLGLSSKDMGIAYLVGEYYSYQNDSCYLLTTSARQIKEEAEDAQLTHPNRIKRLLLLSLVDMIDSLKKFETGTLASHEMPLKLDDLKKKALGKEVQTLRKKANENVLPDFYFFSAGTYYSLSKPILQFGFTSNLVLQLKKLPQVLVGINANIMLFGTPSNQITIPIFASSSVVNYDLGIKLLKQIKNNLFLNCNPQINLGYIREVSSGNRKNILGAEVDFGVYLIPPIQEGIYSGINLFYRNTNTEYLGSSFGLKLDLGYRF